jgi:hypothetical protein
MRDDVRLFETELVIDVSGDEPLRLCRMVFTAHELRALSVLLNAGAGAVGYGFTARTLTRHFVDAWRMTEGRHG